ncbi:MAG: twin-arginine translocation signal domain-containing protein, partial [Planctomycetaceae bacterium]|nr:twin-arginine translocation signal domain-containing protein [Planctomycetaceae bacterium]
MHFSRRKFIGTALATGAVASTTAVPSLAAA